MRCCRVSVDAFSHSRSTAGATAASAEAEAIRESTSRFAVFSDYLSLGFAISLSAALANASLAYVSQVRPKRERRRALS